MVGMIFMIRVHLEIRSRNYYLLYLRLIARDGGGIIEIKRLRKNYFG